MLGEDPGRKILVNYYHHQLEKKKEREFF